MSRIQELYAPNQGLFKSALRAPQVVDLSAPHSEYKLKLVQDQQVIHDGTGLNSGPVTVPVWGYKGKGLSFSSPGPILLTAQNHSISVTWKNELPATTNRPSIFPFDFQGTLPPVLTEKYPKLKADIITHVHGAAIPSGSDGWPTECYGPGQRRTHLYHNQQPATTIWYHDHAMDQTGLNVYAGIAGGYVILDQTDQTLSAYLTSLGGNGPGWAETFGHGPAGIPLVIQDRLLSDDGTRYVYTSNYDDTTPNTHGIKVGTGGEFFGRINLVNGQVSPNLSIGPTALRLKLLNGCNSRFLVLCFVDDQDQLQSIPVYHIGDDHGRRDTASLINTGISPIRIGPGERLDVVADFSGFRNRKIRLVDIGAAPFGGVIPEWAGSGPQALDAQWVKDRILQKRTHSYELDQNGNDTKTYNNFPEILQFEIADVAAAAPVNVNTLNRILLTGNAVKTRVIALREFVMYCEMMQHGQHQHSHHYVERCAPDQFANGDACEAAAMLVLEELEPANPGDPVIVQTQFDLFDPNNRGGSFDYKLVGNTAGSLDAGYQGGKLRYKDEMQQAWLDHPYVVKADSTEVWRFVNLTGDTHPMHIHLTGFRVVESSTVTFSDQGKGVVSTLNIASSQVAPNFPDHLLGNKDTVQVDPETILTVVGKFEGGTGSYVYHCHMLEHEDHMMMRKFKVV